jgi:glucose-1-phosphate cytidylyltransferase
MKVVLFCGGLGMRLKETEESLPKPLVRIGYMPILWHVMKYYAHFGHTDFILCILNDFVMTNGGRDIRLLNHDMKDWRITFVDTGTYSTIGQRLMSVRRHLEGEEMFLANYSDGLTDLPLADLINLAQQENRIATFLCVKPNLTYHFVTIGDRGKVTGISDIRGSNIRINGGFYVFRQGIFDYIKNGEELVPGPFQRLAEDSQLSAYCYDGFWAGMDTFKDKQQLEDMHTRGQAPWELWNQPTAAPSA